MNKRDIKLSIIKLIDEIKIHNDLYYNKDKPSITDAEYDKLVLKLIGEKNKLNNLIGFMENFKGNFMVFKVKDTTKKRHKGARCDQAGKADAIKTMNAISGKSESYSSIAQKELCVLQELTLRLYNREQKNDKIWFLTPTEAVIMKEGMKGK